MALQWLLALRVVLRIAAPADEDILDRARGQTSDLGVVLVPVDGPLDANLDAQRTAARRLAGTHAADIVAWVARPGDAPPVLYAVRPASGGFVTRAVEPPAGRALEASASAETAALVLRSSILALTSTAPRSRSAVTLIAAVGAQVVGDGVSQGGQIGATLTVGVDVGWLELAIGGAFGPERTVTDTLTDLHVARHALSLSAAVTGGSRRLRGSIGLAGGLLFFTRSTTVRATDLQATDPATTVAAFVGPQATVAIRPTSAPVWLTLTLAGDWSPGAPTFGYRSGGDTVTLHDLWTVEPRVGLAVSFSTD